VPFSNGFLTEFGKPLMGINRNNCGDPCLILRTGGLTESRLHLSSHLN
jgi:hypothetical protein